MDDLVFALGVVISYPQQAEEADPGVPMDGIRELIDEAASDPAAARARVLDLLAERPALSRWVARIRADTEHRPPHLQPDAHRGVGLDGRGVPGAESYSCAEHGFTWFKMKVGEQVPRCPFGGEALVED